MLISDKSAAWQGSFLVLGNSEQRIFERMSEHIFIISGVLACISVGSIVITLVLIAAGKIDV